MINERKILKNTFGVTARPVRLRDSDGDRVPNIMDCQPHNRNKQGILHELKKRHGKRVLAKIKRIEIKAEERAEERQQEGTIKRDIERRKQRIVSLRTGTTFAERKRSKVAKREKIRKQNIAIVGGIKKGGLAIGKAILGPPPRKGKRKATKPYSPFDTGSLGKLF